MNVYIIMGDEIALIDTGPGDPKSLQTISDSLNDIGLELKDIDKIINTHEHVEHFAGDEEIKKTSGALVSAHKKAANIIQNFTKYVSELFNAIRGAELEPRMKAVAERYLSFQSSINSSKVEKPLRNGDVVDLGPFVFDVIHTPGHAPGHVCFYDEKRKILFSGDHVLGVGTPFVGYGITDLLIDRVANKLGIKKVEHGNMTDYLNSLEHILTLDIKTILPAHGPIITEPYRKIRDDLDRKLLREQMILKALERGEDTLEGLTQKAYGSFQLDYLLKGSTLAYIDRLLELRKIEKVERGKETYYRLINR
ncbi:MAG: MBL fold metallo-hydrolase [Candidatus Jordarchaeum sp.]|uniref:MBL fold metallo-hydrolase n=1 Tax=Candidatus Jordarchaeum sp. TaxID=2823881 RepID=UPI004049D1B7